MSVCVWGGGGGRCEKKEGGRDREVRGGGRECGRER